MEEKVLFHDRYQLIRLLGRGNFSEVWLANDIKTKTNVALKIYAPASGLDDTGLDIFAREFAIVVNANQKNLLRPLHYDTFDRKPYLVLPYCQSGSTQKRVGIFKEKEIWKFIHDVAAGLSYLHAMKPPVIHQDIKPDNVMMSDSGDYMLTDFGVSSHCRSVLRKSMSESFSSAGTTAYMAPERFGKNGNVPIMASDIYSLAATAFELLTGDAPFGNEGGLLQKKGADIPQLADTYSSDLRKVINLCLNEEPWKRPTAAELMQYADKAMRGERFLVKGEKSFLHKFWPIILGLLFVVCGGICWGVNQYREQQKEQHRLKVELETQHFNDSICSVIQTHINLGDSLSQLGFNKVENYDLNLLSARQQYGIAVNQMQKLKNVGSKDFCQHIHQQIRKIDTCLVAAHFELMKKIEFFHDDPEYQIEFQNRANNISKIIKTDTK